MNYSDLLSTINWRKKRLEILFRDNWRCQECSRSHNSFRIISNARLHKIEKATDADIVHLEVHHKLYRLNKSPWSVPNDDLVTLCSACHIYHHLNHENIVIDQNGNSANAKLGRCSRCAGRGFFPEYRHVENGICFKCRGRCYLPNFNVSSIDETLSHELDVKSLVNETEITLLDEYLNTNTNVESFIEFLCYLDDMIKHFKLSFFDDRFVPMFYLPYDVFHRYTANVVVGYDTCLRHINQRYAKHIKPTTISIKLDIDKDEWIDNIKNQLEIFIDYNHYERFNYKVYIVTSSISLSKFKSPLLYLLASDHDFRDFILSKYV